MHSLPGVILLYLAILFYTEDVFKPGAAWFLKIDSVWIISMHVRVRVCVCVHA